MICHCGWVDNAMSDLIIVCRCQLMSAQCVYVRDVTVISPCALLMFGGDITIKHRQQLVSIDNFITLRVSQTLAPLNKIPPLFVVISYCLFFFSPLQTFSPYCCVQSRPL